MKLQLLPKLTTRSKKRIGRGIGSGKGKTSARGSKGQKARGKIPAATVGGGLILYKRLPFVRGWGNAKAGIKPAIITLSSLNEFKPNSVVNLQAVIDQGLVSASEAQKKGVKILYKGELKIPLKIELSVSAKVKEMIEKVGGQVVC